MPKLEIKGKLRQTKVYSSFQLLRTSFEFPIIRTVTTPHLIILKQMYRFKIIYISTNKRLISWTDKIILK